MIKLYPEQFYKHINNELKYIYLFIGNDQFLLKESNDFLIKKAISKGFEKHYTFILDNNHSTNWQSIFYLCQTMSLFESGKIIQIELHEYYLNSVCLNLINKLFKTILSLLNKNLLLIVHCNNLTKKQKNTFWFQTLVNKAILVICNTPDKNKLPIWVAAEAKRKQLILDNAANNFLCISYEGNLLGIAQLLDIMSLLWPDGKLTLPRVKQIVFKTEKFTNFQWIEALLTANSKRALHILQSFCIELKNPIILLRILQQELLLLLKMKRQKLQSQTQIIFYNKVWQLHRTMLTKALNRLSINQLTQAIQLLLSIELKLKNNEAYSTKLVWNVLEMISLLLC